MRSLVDSVLCSSANLGFAARTALSRGGIIVLVCVGGQPCGERVVYEGARLAGARGEGDALGGDPQRVDPLGV